MAGTTCCASLWPWPSNACGKEDVMGRLGGEEFAIFCPTPMGRGAEAVAERLRPLVETQPLRSDHHAIPVTVSIG